jgi:hypothetical protein
MKRLFDRSSISRRLLFISAAFTLPMAVMLTLIVTTINKDLTFTELELQGNAYQRPLEKLLAGMSEHRRLSAAPSAGGDARRVQEEVDSAFADLVEVDAKVGTALQFTTEGLSQRKRDHVRVENVRREWNELKARGGNVTADVIDERHAHLIADVRTMITHAGDTSNLILDPDLDSYYTMDMTLLALPQTQDRTAALVVMAQQRNGSSLSEAQRIEFAVAAALLQTSDVDRIVADAETAINEDKNFNGASDALQANLPPAVSTYKEEAAKLVREVHTAVSAPGPFQAESIVAAGLATQKASFRLWDIAAGELDGLLQARMSIQSQSRIVAVASGLLAWLAALAFVFVVSRGITRGLSDITSELGQSASQVASASGEVAGASQSLSQGSTEQAASLEETSASMEEMASMTRRNAENSQQAASVMAETEKLVHGANDALGEMVTSMTAIKESSDKVAKIIKTIDEIAFQTNILALNAAVEAARAGEAGMGFAVVADEVRSLAQRSAQAAKDTAGLIEESIVKSNEGQRKVQTVTVAIESITSSTVKVKGLVDEVSEASRQQSQGIDQVSQAIAQMEKVTQGTAATAEEAAAASEELSAQAETSMSVVARLAALVGGTSAADAPVTRRKSTSVKASVGKVVSMARPAKMATPKSAEEEIPLDATGTYGSF